MSEINTRTDSGKLTVGAIITIIHDVMKNWYMIVAAALVAAMMAFVFVDFTFSPVYRTTATFVVSSGSTTGTAYANLSSANNTATVLTEVMGSSILRAKVLEEIGLDSFDGQITAEVSGDTNLLIMTVTGSDPREVFLMAKGMAEHHHIVSDKALSGTVVELLDPPYAPVHPINTPGIIVVMIKAALLAAMAAAAVFVVLAYLADKVRSREEADEKLTCHLIGELCHEKKRKTLGSFFGKNKRSILITNHLTSFVYTESVHKIAGRVDRHRHKGEKTIMVTSVLENEGKSTVAANLAISLAKKGKKVLLMDCDLRKPSMELIFDLGRSDVTIVDVLNGRAKAEDAVRQLENSGIWLMPARKSLKAATNMLHSKAMEKLLEEAGKSYDIIIMDVPPMAMATDAENLTQFVDTSLLVVRQNAATADQINDAAEVLGKGSHLIGCVLNNVYGSAGFTPVSGYGGYGRYGKYGKYGKYGRYGYGSYKKDSKGVDE